jgi:tRNA pseudouridine13 synthase
MRSADESLPFLTAAVPGTGGRMRERAEDFVVEEVPLYPFSGGGEHTCLLVEKTGIPTSEAVRRMARELGCRENDFGFAGHKDARAVTRQWFTIARLSDVDAWGLQVPGLKLLEVTRHRNRLKIGHLAGNRFEIVLRGTAKGAEDSARKVLSILARRGVPNYFGVQRFGSRGDSDLVGRELVLGSAEGALHHLLGSPREGDGDRVARELFEAKSFREAHDAWPRGDRAARKALQILVGGATPERALSAWTKRLRFLFVSACQSRMFNQVLAARVEKLDELQAGDLAYLHRNGAVFEVVDVLKEQARAASFEISPSGPMFGYKMLLASGEPGNAEREVLAGSGLELEMFKGKLALKARGERRSLRVPLSDVEVEAFEADAENCLRLRFRLPAGSFATSVLRELRKAFFPVS